eukprot:3387006-Pleurochrysis_carterae.AAC.1
MALVGTRTPRVISVQAARGQQGQVVSAWERREDVGVESSGFAAAELRLYAHAWSPRRSHGREEHNEQSGQDMVKANTPTLQPSLIATFGTETTRNHSRTGSLLLKLSHAANARLRAD